MAENPLMTPKIEPATWQKALAEFIGTLALIYVGVLVLSAIPNPSLITVAFAHGLTIAVMASATFEISGGQLNPAVTLGLLAGRKIGVPEAATLIGAQLAGGIVGGFLALWSIPGGAIAAGVPGLAANVSPATGILIEVVLTFFLMFVIYGTAVDNRFGGRLGALAIGFTVALDIMAGGPLTGAAMNPARWLGAAVPAGVYADWYVYWIGPIAGAILAGFVYVYGLMTPKGPGLEEPAPPAKIG